MRPLIALAPILMFVSSTASVAHAGDNLIGLRTSLLRFSGEPAEGKLYKLRAKARGDGNPSDFPLPEVIDEYFTPDDTTSYVRITQDGGVLFDPLTHGEWKGIGRPKGSKGWKYTNKLAPWYGQIALLKVTNRSIKILAKSTGTLPAPSADNGAIHTVIQLGSERYCTEARVPHAKVSEGRIVKSKKQFPASACAIECEYGDDTDNDRLTDCVETNTSVFLGQNDTGTDPLNEDTDEDGIRDGDEVLGSVNGLDLPAFGLSPLRKEFLVEYDWFEDDLNCGPHSHRPGQEMLDLLEEMYANAPVANPDGSTGITLIQDIGQGAPFDGGTAITDEPAIVESWTGLYDKYFTPNREAYFRHALSIHDVVGSGFSGAATDDSIMVIMQRCSSNPFGAALIVAHELGHTLGLHHGGNEGCNHKPNYNSVMNYAYWPGISADCTPTSDGVLNYSSGTRLPLDESNLDESEGICGFPPVDWNGDSIIESGIVMDLNAEVSVAHQEISCGGVYTVLRDHDDWGNLDMTYFRRFRNLPIPGVGDNGHAFRVQAAGSPIFCNPPVPE